MRWNSGKRDSLPSKKEARVRVGKVLPDSYKLSSPPRFRQHSSRSFNNFLEIVPLKNNLNRRSMKIRNSLSLMRQRKLKINKNFKLIDRYRRFPVTRSSSAVPNNKDEWFLDEKDAKIFALGTEKVVVDSSSRFSSPSSVSSVTGYRTTRCAMDATGMDSSTSLHHFSSAKFASIWIFIVHPR